MPLNIMQIGLMPFDCVLILGVIMLILFLLLVIVLSAVFLKIVILSVIFPSLVILLAVLICGFVLNVVAPFLLNLSDKAMSEKEK
jgi:hypothetical protein